MAQQPTFQFVKPQPLLPREEQPAASSSAVAVASAERSPSSSASDYLLPGGPDSLTSPSSGEEPASTPLAFAHAVPSASTEPAGAPALAAGSSSPSIGARFTPLTLPSPLQRGQSGRATSSGAVTPLPHLMAASSSTDAFTLTPFTSTAPSTATSTRPSGLAPPASPGRSLLESRAPPSSASSPSPFPSMSRASSANLPSYERADRNAESKAERELYGAGADRPLLGSDDESDVKGLGKSVASTYYEQYEATVNKIRQRRQQEAEEKALAGRRAPDQTKRELRVVGLLLLLVLVLVALVVFIFYPRVPSWSVSAVSIPSMRLWSDGTGDFALRTHFAVRNDNFLSTGIDSIELAVSHNGTQLGSDAAQTGIKLAARQTSRLGFELDFSPLDADTFGDVFSELARTGGQLTVEYDVGIVTSENFRIRNIQMACTAVLQLSAREVPPTAEVYSNACTHHEQTG